MESRIARDRLLRGSLGLLLLSHNCIEPSRRNSARNFLHYLSVRQHDIRSLQEDLGSLGLSSLGVLEPHAMASLNAVMGILEQLTGTVFGERPEPPVDFHTGPLLLRDHTRALLGPEPRDRFVRIMVSMPSEAAADARLVHDLLVAGMDVMRINCAHDGPRSGPPWSRTCAAPSGRSGAVAASRRTWQVRSCAPGQSVQAAG